MVAPASVKYQWQTEIERFSDLSAQVIDGPKPRRNRLYADPVFFNLIKYELVLKDMDRIQALAAGALYLCVVNCVCQRKIWRGSRFFCRPLLTRLGLGSANHARSAVGTN